MHAVLGARLCACRTGAVLSPKNSPLPRLLAASERNTSCSFVSVETSVEHPTCCPVVQVTGASWLAFGLADLYYTRTGVSRNGDLSAAINLSLGAYFLYKASPNKHVTWNEAVYACAAFHSAGCASTAAGLPAGSRRHEGRLSSSCAWPAGKWPQHCTLFDGRCLRRSSVPKRIRDST